MTKQIEVKTYIEKVDKLVHNDINPRKINKKRYQELLKSLKEFPEMKQLREIVVDEKFLVLAGDKRLYGLKEIGFEEVPIKQVFGLPERKKQEFIAKDNDHYGDWDAKVIDRMWDVKDFDNWGIKSFKPPSQTKKKVSFEAKSKKEPESCTCPNCGFKFDPAEENEE